MEPGTILLVLVLPLAVFLVAVVFLMGRVLESPAVVGHDDELESEEPPRRQWWGNPLVWLAVAAIFVLLGVFVAPGLFGGVFIFIPFMWIRFPRHKRRRNSAR